MAKAVLLDTCALLWIGGAPDRISAATRKRLESADAVYASPVSLWEVAFKVALGKLELTMTPEEWFEMVKADYGISVLPLSEAVMLKAADLPLHHRDPADRFIIATALIHQLPVLTGDKRFPLYGVKTIL